MNPVKFIGLIGTLLTWLLDKAVTGVKSVPHWLGTWKQELVGIPVTFLLFFFSAYGFRILDPTSGSFDVGVLQTALLACCKFVFFALVSWVMIRHGFKEIWDYLNTEFSSDWKLSNQHFKIKIALGVFFGIILMLTLLDRASAQPCVVKAAQNEIGVRELSGNNDGKKVEVYLSSVHLKRGNPWCAAFVAWCHDQCDIKHPVSGFSPDWFRSQIIYYRSSNKQMAALELQGGVFGIWFASKQRIAHVGIIQQVKDQYVITIEGNTNEAGSREGDGVYRKKRLLRQIYAVSKWSQPTGDTVL